MFNAMFRSEPGDWKCYDCGKMNFKRRRRCFGCGRDHYATSSSNSMSSIGGRPGDWKCPGCGFLLFASKTKCKKCNITKGESINSDRLTEQSPHSSHSSQPPRREGDWDCRGCGEFQFAKNMFCRDCGYPKDGRESLNEEEGEDSDICVVCMDAPKTVMLMHSLTGHTCCCAQCAQSLMQNNGLCPICRAPIEKVIRNFTS